MNNSHHHPPPSDESSLADVGELYRDEFPGMSETFERLYKERVGRAIVLTKKVNDNISHLLPASQQESLKPQVEIEHIGHILPLNQEENQHLLVFRDGSMAVIEPANTELSIIEFYKNYFSSDESDFEFPNEYYQEATVRDNFLKSPSYQASRIVYRNRTKADSEKMLPLIDQADTIASELKAEGDKSRHQTASYFIGKFNPPPVPPPAESPSPPPPTK